MNLQLKWMHQFQFAGYYAAKAQGYYRQAGLEVNFVEANPKKKVVDAVMDGTAQYGIDVSTLLLERAKGKPIVALGVIFQHSPVIVIASQKTPTQNIHDLAGKRLMIDENADDITAYLKKEGLRAGTFTPVKHSFDIQDLLTGKVDAISAYSTNECFYLDKIGFQYSAYSPRSAGIDFYGDTLFTSEREIQEHPARAKAFLEASLRGWKYAMDHQEEIVDLIFTEYSQKKSREHLLYEARQMTGLIHADIVEIGYMNPGRWRHIADTYADLGMLPRDFDLSGFLYDPDPKRDYTRILMLAKALAACLAGTLVFVVLLRKMVRVKTGELDSSNRELAEQKNQLASIINGTSDAVFIKETSGRYVVVNHEVERLFGMTSAEIVGCDDSAFFPPPESGWLREKDLAIMNGDRVVTHDEQLTTADGPRTYQSTKGPIRDEHGAVTGLFGISRDISDRIQFEDKLRLERDRAQNYLDTVETIIVALDTQGNITTINRKGCQVLGESEADLLGRSWFSDCAAQPAGMERAHPVFLQLLAGSIDETVEYQEYALITKGGELRHIAWHNAVLHDERGRITGTLSAGDDQTEFIRAGAENALLEEKLKQAQKMESIGRLAGGVAHDFNNLLTVILGYSEMGLRGLEASQPLHTNLYAIRKAAVSASELTKQLLAFARKQPIKPKVVNLNHTVRGTLNMLQRVIGERIGINWQLAPSLWPVKMDASQIDQILANLCINARDAIADVGTITIATGNSSFDPAYCESRIGYEPGEYVRLEVSDSGCGMDEGTQALIFEPFFTTKGVGAGTGLGLATVYGIVKQNGGFICVNSELGHGSTFTIYLPRHAGALPHAEPEVIRKPLRGGKETILLVEDDPAILEMATTILQGQGYRLLTAGSPEEALRQAREFPVTVHLLMTDVIMPEMNGRDLAERITLLHPRIKCLFVSGYTAEVIAHQGALEEGVHFLQKPFSMNALAAKVRDLLDNG